MREKLRYAAAIGWLSALGLIAVVAVGFGQDRTSDTIEALSWLAIAATALMAIIYLIDYSTKKK